MGLSPCLAPFFIMSGSASESGDAASEGPLGDDVRERCNADVDFEASLIRALARSP